MCTAPIDAWRGKERGESGKFPLVFNVKDGESHRRSLVIPCGRCMECRLRKKREWALRCEHEASLHDENCWFTLTYDDAHLPDRNSLRRRDLQLFLKRLRKVMKPFRFFGCGEYGDDSNRPH